MSVYGTGGKYLKLSEFSRKYVWDHYPLVRRLTVLSGFSSSGGFAYQNYTYAIQRPIPSGRRSYTLSSSHRNKCQYRNINLLSIDYAFRLRLRSRLTLIRLALIKETLVYWRVGFPPTLSLLMPTFSFPIAPTYLTIHLLRRLECSPTIINDPQLR